MKEFGISDHDYEHKISIPLRTIMCIDLPRVDYDAGKKVKKVDFDAASAANKEASERMKKKKMDEQNKLKK